MQYAFAAHGLLLVTIIWMVSRRYGTIIHPVAYFGGFYAVQTAISPALYGAIGLFDRTADSAIITTVAYSSLYFACIGLPFLTKPSLVYTLMRSATTQLLPRPPRMGRLIYIAIIVQFLLFFGLLMATSGTTEWITSPRVAYQESRAGAGVWWSLCQSMLVLLVAAFLSRKARSIFAAGGICLCSAVVAFFLGSKAFMLFPFILAAFYYEHRVRKIPRMWVLLGALGMVSGVFLLQFLQGTAGDLVETIAYFNYFPNTATFMEDFEWRFQHTWGATNLSTLWQFVPRGLYPDKPFVYGQIAIMEDYSPGAAELGATPGILPWAAAYMDFGVPGIIIDGLLTGAIAKGAFALLRRQTDVTSLIIFGQIGLITTAFASPFYGAPFLIFWAWLAGELAIFQLVAGMRAAFAKNLRQSAALNELHIHGHK